MLAVRGVDYTRNLGAGLRLITLQKVVGQRIMA